MRFMRFMRLSGTTLSQFGEITKYGINNNACKGKVGEHDWLKLCLYLDSKTCSLSVNF